MNYCVKTDFPGGNACDISIDARGDKTQIAFAPDPHGGPETLWFHFRVLRAASETPDTIELLLKHSYNMLGGHQPQNLRPVIRYAESDWQRLGAPAIEETPDGRALVKWQIAAPQTSVEVAVCFPYGQDELDTLLHETGDYWKRDVIGVGQRSTPLVRIANDYGHLNSERPGLYLIARQHSGETPGSWVLDGFLRRVAELGESAPLVWALPLSDPDGVHAGDYGKDQFPYDLNRAWESPPMRHETLAARWDVNRWSHRCKPVLAMDFHAPGACETDGLYCFLPDDEKFPQRHQAALRWTERIQEELQEYSAPRFSRVAKYKSRWETSNFARFIEDEYKITGISLEVPYSICGERVLSREDYREAGARICNAVCALLPETPASTE